MNNMMDLANYIIQRAIDRGTPITNLHLQKILYFVFRESIQDGENINFLRRIYDENFLVWRYGPVVETVYEEYSSYGSMEIDEPTEEPRRNYRRLDAYIDENIDENVFSLVNESHRHQHWVTNESRIQIGRSNIPYTFEDLDRD